jgi:hypothetical protein
MVPDAECFGNGIDVGSVAIAVKNKFELIVAIAYMFVGDFTPHDMRSQTRESCL